MMSPENFAFIREQFFILAVCMARLSAAFAVTPFFGQQALPGLTRQGVVLGFALILMPLVAPELPAEPLSFARTALLLMKEVIIGMVIGFYASIPFWIAQSAGFLIDNQRGATMGGAMDPASGEQSSSLGALFQQTLTVLFFTSGAFLAFLGALFETYRIYPVFSYYPQLSPEWPEMFLGLGDKVLRLAVLYGAPAVIVMFLAEFGLGLMNRFAQQLNVFFLAMPVKSIIAVFLLVLYMGSMFVFLRAEFPSRAGLHGFLQGVFL